MTGHRHYGASRYGVGWDDPMTQAKEAQMNYVEAEHKRIEAAVVNLPPLYSQENEDDPVAQVKLFLPGTRWSWHLLEYDPEERLGFCWVQSGLGADCDELGYVALDELLALRGALGLRVELDRYYTPKALSALKREGGRQR